ncbi:hypothetical protein [Flectobacillus major]|uniref:hypothetical protein n=1 Tax=Flectobacillus major TaxID=103 RepID=UPI00040517B9|nr:hypothetical protein [Flectobacillus major]
MKTILSGALFIHILSGFLALIVGLVAMIAKKGGKTHVIWGKVYYYAMMSVAITALIRFQMEVRLIFLGCIAIFSFYNTFTGVRLIRMKRGIQPTALDWTGAIIALLGALVMLGFGIWAFSKGITFYFVLFFVFGAFSMALAVQDLLVFIGKKKVENIHWLLNHISRMGGSYIATVTAFLVVNNHEVLPPLVAWLAPGAIGGAIIARTRAYYKQKMTLKLKNN